MTSRTRRIRFLIIVTALVAFFGLAHFAVRKISTGPLGTLVEKNLTHVLGLEVTLDELEVALLPTPHLHAEGVRVANLPGRPAPHLLSIERFDLGIQIWPLLKRIVVVDTIEIENAELHIETDSKGRFAGGLELAALVHDGDEDSVQLELRDLQLETLRVFYRDGRDGASRSLILDSVAIESKELGSEISLEIQGKFEGSPIALSGQIGSLRELLERTQPFPVDLHGQIFEADFDAKGTVREPWTLNGLEVEISGEIPELIVQDHPLPQLGIVHFDGNLSNVDGSLGLERFSLDSTETVPVRIAVHGKMDDLLGLKEVDFEIQIETLSLEFLRPLLQSQIEFSLPTIASLSANMKLADQDGRIDLDGSVHAVTSGDVIEMHAEGGIRDLTHDAKVDVKIDSRAEDLASITSRIPEFPTHGKFGPLTASTHLRSRDGALAADQIAVRLGDREHAWAELDGDVADVVALRNVDLKLVFGAQSLHHLKELLRRELPETSALKGSAAISDKDGTLGFDHLRLHGGQNSPVEVHLEAQFDDLEKRDEIEVELGIRGDDTRVLGAIMGIDLPVITPVEFYGKVKGSDEHIEVESMTLRLGETRLEGNLSGSFLPDQRPSVKAQLTSDDVRLQDLGLIGSDQMSSLLDRGGPRKQADPGSLPFERLRQVDLDLGVRFDHVGGYQGFDANDAGFMLRLHDGDMVVTDVGANYRGGDLSAELRVDARTTLPRLKAELQTRSLDIARLVSQFDEKTEYSGIIDGELELEAAGTTFDSIRRSLAGSIRVSMRDGNAASRITREFVVSLTDVVFPGFLTKKVPNIGCAIIDLEIEAGIASVRTLLLRGKEVGVIGTGEVDLVRGLYDLHIVPKTANPGILSVAPEVHVVGPLDNPQFIPEKRTLVTSFGRGLLHNAVKLGGALLFPFGRGSDKSGVSPNDCRPTNPGSS